LPITLFEENDKNGNVKSRIGFRQCRKALVNTGCVRLAGNDDQLPESIERFSRPDAVETTRNDIPLEPHRKERIQSVGALP
jgi:hypothetical protein